MNLLSLLSWDGMFKPLLYASAYAEHGVHSGVQSRRDPCPCRVYETDVPPVIWGVSGASVWGTKTGRLHAGGHRRVLRR